MYGERQEHQHVCSVSTFSGLALANTFAALLFLSPFFEPGHTDEEAARVQANAMVRVLRLVGEIEETPGSPGSGRTWRKLPIDWMEEADRVEGFAREGEWCALIDWAQETRRKIDPDR